VDEHGFRRRWLRRHSRKIAEFFDAVTGRSYRSEAARTLQTRFIKNRDKLFTFVEHDGVPWHNNAAENAIRQFAYVRETAAGWMKEIGLADHLTLLSLLQTCRCRGVDFLKFLRSGARDIDAFAARKRVRRRHPEVELYPAGFFPPHLARLREYDGAALATKQVRAAL
jgi:hypothetical protein